MSQSDSHPRRMIAEAIKISFGQLGGEGSM
jgi:hypothetical protein